MHQRIDAASKALQQGLIVFGVILFGAYLLYERGLMGLLLEGDRSRLSWLIIAIWAVMSARWFYLLRWVQAAYESAPADNLETREAMMARWLNHGWFAADAGAENRPARHDYRLYSYAVPDCRFDRL